MDKKGKQIAANHAGEIDEQELYRTKKEFNGTAKKIQGDHVENKVHPVNV
jgi:hypothetical protein